MTDTDKKPQILIVDDVPINIHLLASLLDPDYEVSAVTSGQKVLQNVLKTQPDLILLDMIMPDMDGFAVCEILKAKAETKDIPVIFVSGETGAEMQAKGLALGAADFITKPVKPSVLESLLHTHLKRGRP